MAVRDPRLKLSADLHPGFGLVTLYHGDEVVWSDVHGEGWRHGRRAENAARKDPKGSWRLVVDGPLSGGIFRRFGPNDWRITEINRGFA